MKRNIAVIFGGDSPEHEVSVDSGHAISANMDKKLFNPLPLYVDRRGRWFLTDRFSFVKEKKICKKGEVFLRPNRGLLLKSGVKIRPLKIYKAFPIIHGQSGEDGRLQGSLEIGRVPYVGSGVFSSALCMNKIAAKIYAGKLDIPLLPHVIVRRGEKVPRPSFKYPVFVKPVSLGSSIGVFRADSYGELVRSVNKCLKFEGEIMIEKGVDKAREIVCGILERNGRLASSPCGMIVPRRKFYDYKAKYLDDKGFHLFIPARIEPKVSESIREMSGNLFKAVSAKGLARVDFLMDKKDWRKFYFCEINTLPGFTSHSLYPAVWERAGISMKNLITILLEGD